MRISILIILLSSLLMQADSSIYSVSQDFKVSTDRNYNQLAYADYQVYIYEKGWNYLHIYANIQKGLLEQHRGAGFLEGYLTYKEIYSAFQNLVGSILKGQQSLSNKAQDFIDQQIDYIETMIKTHPRQLYWQYAQAYLEQLRYMYRGYLTRINIENSPSMYISFSQFYFLTNVGDLEDLIPAFHDSQSMQSHIEQNLKREGGNCNAFVKIIDNKLFFAQSTHNIYSFLLRIFKTYSFPTRNQNVGNQWFSFSSRPGDLISKDDFYVLSNGMVVMETSLANMNSANYNDLSPNTVPCWLRATIAVNLAKNGTNWADYFLKARSGTHNNQWLISDPNQLTIDGTKNVITLVQQGFSEYSVVDMTGRLNQKGYIASYNIPYTQKIYSKLSYQKYPYSYDNQPRAFQFQRYNQFVKNANDMKSWFLYNEYQSPKTGLAPRYDLDEQKPSAFGLTDLKVMSPGNFEMNFIWAISGPSLSVDPRTAVPKYPAFDWQKWPNVPHYGMPKVWNFDWQKYEIISDEQLKNQYFKKVSEDKMEVREQ